MRVENAPGELSVRPEGDKTEGWGQLGCGVREWLLSGTGGQGCKRFSWLWLTASCRYVGGSWVKALQPSPEPSIHLKVGGGGEEATGVDEVIR